MTRPTFESESFIPALSWFVVKFTILRDPMKINEVMAKSLSPVCPDCKYEFTYLVLNCLQQIMGRLIIIDPSADAVFDEVLDVFADEPGYNTGVTIAAAVASDSKNAMNLVSHTFMEGIFEESIMAVCEIFSRFYHNAALDNREIQSEIQTQLSTLNENIQSWVDQNGYE